MADTRPRRLKETVAERTRLVTAIALLIQLGRESGWSASATAWQIVTLIEGDKA